ncbi:MAG: hypothetical protein JWR77_1613 [Rhizorhabdus sp.]|nr:hypothetical protein [Rhizorhabdus sp.]
MYHNFSYPAVLSVGQRIAWQIDDVLPLDARLDFTRPFMPEALARICPLGLNAAEALALNHIRGHEYLAIFGLVEEFILPFVLDHIREDLAGDDRVRALLQFASEEAKHIQLFDRFRSAFAAGLPVECAMIGPSEAIAVEVLRHHPLSVALLILHIEWMSQSHYLDSVRDDNGIDPLFASLLRHHWIEEAQHAKLDTLIVEALAARLTTDEIDAAVDGYLEIGAFFASGFAAQAEFNLAAFERVVGRTLDGDGHAAFLQSQHRALCWTYLGSGMVHPDFNATLDTISPTARAKVAAVAATLS